MGNTLGVGSFRTLPKDADRPAWEILMTELELQLALQGKAT